MYLNYAGSVKWLLIHGNMYRRHVNYEDSCGESETGIESIQSRQNQRNSLCKKVDDSRTNKGSFSVKYE